MSCLRPRGCGEQASTRALQSRPRLARHWSPVVLTLRSDAGCERADRRIAARAAQSASGLPARAGLRARGRRPRPRSASPAPIRSPAACTPAATAAGSGRCGSTPASAPPPSRTGATATCSSSGTTGLSVAFDLPTQIGYDSDDPHALGEVGRVGVAIDSLEDMEALLDGIPLDRVSTSMTINATAAILLALYVAVARRRGIAESSLSGHGAERHPEGVRGARHLHLPARAVAAPGDRRVRLLRASRCRAGTPSRSPATTSARPGRRRRRRSPSPSRTPSSTCARRAAAGLDPERFGERLSLLLRLPLRLHRGGGEVPRRAARCGRGSMKERCGVDEPEGAAAALPRADGRRHAHRPAARQQRGARGAAGAGRGAGRLPEPAHQRAGRGAGAAHRGLGAPGPAHAAGHRVRVGRRRHRRPAGRLLRGGGGHRPRGARGARPCSTAIEARGGRAARPSSGARSSARSRSPPTASSARWRRASA